MFRFARSLQTIGLIALICSASAQLEAARYSHHRGRSGISAGQLRARIAQQAAAVRADMAAANQILQSAETARAEHAAKESESIGKISSARTSMLDAHKELSSTSIERKKLEADIESQAGPEAPIAQARDAYESAKQDCIRQRDRVLTSAAYREKKAAAEAANKTPAELAKLRSDMLSADHDYFAAAAVFSASRSKYRQLQHELFSQNQQWLAITETARTDQKEETQAAEKAQGGGLHKFDAAQRKHEAEQIKAAAQARIAQGQAALAYLQQRYRGYGGKYLPGMTPQTKPATKSAQ